MDRKSIIILLASFVFLILWSPFVTWLYPPLPLPQGTNLVSSAAAPFASTNLSPSPAPISPFPGSPASSVPAAPFSNAPEEIVAIENDRVRYLITSSGGGIKSMELKGYPATVDCDKRETNSTRQLASLNTQAPLPSLAILGGEALQGDGVFQLTKTPDGVRAEKLLTNGLAIIKEFKPSSNYLLQARIRLENRSSIPLALPASEWVVGSATPIGPHDESLTLGFEWYNGADAERMSDAWFQNRTLGCFPGQPRSLYHGGASNVVWTAVHNQFFTLVAVPETPAPQILGRKVLLPPPSPAALAADSKALAQPYGFQASLVYPSQVLAPNQASTAQFQIFAGPKEYNTLARLGHNLDLIMNFDGFFGFFAKALLLSMNGVHALGIPYGIAIVVITIIIKLVFWPLTNASTKSMKRMAALQPQMKAIQEKYKDDPRKMNMKVMEFMKENKVSPLGGCLPMLLQIPVFFGFYTMLQSAIELRGAQFLWACDLSRPDTIFVIPGLNFPLNPMPLLMGLTMIWQARLTPPAPGMDPVQQKIMKYLPLMFMFFLYNFSAGLTLYWTVQNLLTIAQMKITKSTDPNPAPGNGPKPLPPSSHQPLKKKKTP